MRALFSFLRITCIVLGGCTQCDHSHMCETGEQTQLWRHHLTSDSAASDIAMHHRKGQFAFDFFTFPFTVSFLHSLLHSIDSDLMQEKSTKSGHKPSRWRQTKRREKTKIYSYFHFSVVRFRAHTSPVEKRLLAVVARSVGNSLASAAVNAPHPHLWVAMVVIGLQWIYQRVSTPFFLSPSHTLGAHLAVGAVSATANDYNNANRLQSVVAHIRFRSI